MVVGRTWQEMMEEMKRIYADYAAAAPLCDPARKKMISLLDVFGNPSSVHREGRMAHKIVETARRQAADAIGAEPDEIFFTSGGSEANSLALAQWPEFQVSPIEHASVLRSPNARAGAIMVDRHGTIQPFTAPVASVMLVNNEVGTIQPIRELAIGDDSSEGVTRLLHIDAVQAVGHIPVDVKALRADMLSLSGHKFGAPKGVGALYISKRLNRNFTAPLIYGGGQEHGVRAGTENVLGIAAMGAAIQWAMEHLEEHAEHDRCLRDKLIDGIAAIRGVEPTGSLSHRAPGIASFVVKDVEGPALAAALDEDGIAVSSGSACAAGQLQPSHVLMAMGYESELAMCGLRISIGWQTTQDEVDGIIQAVRLRVRELRGR